MVFRRVTMTLILYVLISVGFMCVTSPVQNLSSSKQDDLLSKVHKLSGDSELLFSTYIGGQSHDNVNSLRTDSQGNIYIVGYTESEDFPTTESAFDGSHNGGSEWWHADAFVMKLNYDGQDIIYSTFLGGSGDDYAVDVIVDELGNAYVVGYTDSSNFPMINAYDASHNGDSDTFVVKLSADGSELLYSTYVGGTGEDIANSIVLDGVQDCIVAGHTSSSNFPVVTTNLQPECHALGYNQDGFVFKLADNGSRLEYSMYLGAGTNDEVRGVAVDSLGNAVIVGSTGAAEFPVVNALDDTLDGVWDCFIAKVNSTGHFIFSTFFGGSDIDYASTVCLDDDGQIYVSGSMKGGTFPYVGVTDQILNGSRGLFLLVLNPLATDIIFSGVINDSADVEDLSFISSIVVISEQEVWLGGDTEYDTFPTTEDAFDRSLDEDDGIIVMVDPVSSSLNFSSFFGGTKSDWVTGLVVTEQGDIIGAGTTTSLDFPICNALEPDKIGTERIEDGFVFRFVMNDTATSTLTTSTSTTTPNGNIDFLFIAIAGISVGLVVVAGVIVITRRS